MNQKETGVCVCDLPFQVGDKVTLHYTSEPYDIIRTVTDVRRTERYWTCHGELVTCEIKVDGGGLCSKCGKAPGKPKGWLIDTWFKMVPKQHRNERFFPVRRLT